MEKVIKKTYMISFKPNADLTELIMVLNSLGLATNDETTAAAFKNYDGIIIREVGVLDGDKK